MFAFRRMISLIHKISTLFHLNTSNNYCYVNQLLICQPSWTQLDSNHDRTNIKLFNRNCGMMIIQYTKGFIFCRKHYFTSDIRIRNFRMTFQISVCIMDKLHGRFIPLHGRQRSKSRASHTVFSENFFLFILLDMHLYKKVYW